MANKAQPMQQAGETHEHYMSRVREWAAENDIDTPAQQEQENNQEALEKDEERSGTEEAE